MEPTKQQYKAAVVQAEPVWLDVDATIDKAIGLIGQASVSSAFCLRVYDAAGLSAPTSYTVQVVHP